MVMQLITISGIRFVGIAFLLSIVLMIYYTISKIKFYNLEYDMVGHVANDFPLSIVFVESNITRISPTGTVSWREFITKEVALESTNYSIAQSWIKQLKICSPRQKNNSDPCDLQEMDLNFLSKWKKNLITDISCDSEANSKIYCYDSPNKSRYCNFYGAMIDTRKMKRYNSSVKGVFHEQRSWEKGFLSIDCGYNSPEDIGYFGLYKPDIQGSSNAKCDYVFNESVIVYSHDNILHLGHTMNDMLNIWSLLFLSDLSNESLVSLLNIDGFRRGKNHNDKLLQFASHYHSRFHNVFGIIDFPAYSKLCFRKLILPPKPMLLFMGDKSSRSSADVIHTSSLNCLKSTINDISNDRTAAINSLFQKWNLDFRSLYGNSNKQRVPLLSVDDNIFQIGVLNMRRYSSGLMKMKISNITELSSFIKKTFSTLTDFVKLDSTLTMLNLDIKSIRVIEIDLSSLSLSQQIQLIAKSNMIIGFHGSGINALSLHMSIGSERCCGVIEIFSQSSSIKTQLKQEMYYHNAAQSIGSHYQSVLANMNEMTISIHEIQNLLLQISINMIKSPSCILTDTIESIIANTVK